MVGIIGQIHKQQIVHRDIKPENFMIKNGEMYIIDFGIANAIDNVEEIKDDNDRTTIIGSPKYISYFIHQGYEPMYRDDLISAGYCFLWFIMEKLPWSNIDVEENGVQEMYPEIHVLNRKNQSRKKQKEWKNIEYILNSLKTKYSVYSYQIPKSDQIFENVFDYFSLCYNLQLGEQPFYDELCKVLLQNL
jgi:serine/threonine protein kinase